MGTKYIEAIFKDQVEPSVLSWKQVSVDGSYQHIE